MPKSSTGLWIELIGNSADFEKIIISAMNNRFTAAVKKSIPLIEKGLESLVYNGISDCPEMAELKNGDLGGELGLTAGVANEAAEDIAIAVSQSIVIQREKASAKDGDGGLTIYIQPSNFENILGINNAVVSYYSKKEKTTIDLDWLNWLLTRGDEIIVSKFRFEPESGRGRTGKGRMKKGGSWRVSPQYAGTEDDNFITRALSGKILQTKMASVIHKAIKKNWK